MLPRLALLPPLPPLPPLLLLLLLLLLRAAGRADACPSACSCKWKAGKEWVECAARGLQGLPQGAREETQVLDLSGNQLFSLEAEGFLALRLVNLQRLYLARSRLRSVARLALSGLQGLVELDLADNELEQPPTESFASVPNLMRLGLAGNPLGELRREAFRQLAQLTFLDLSRCRLARLEAGAFAGLHALEWLKLQDNLLRQVPPATLPTSAGLHGLPLHGNPWLCDCELAALRDWLVASQAQAPQDAEPSCQGPERLRARPVRLLKPQELACLPSVRLPASPLDVYEGDNVTLLCEVQAVPQAAAGWLVNGRSLDLDAEPEPSELPRRVRYSYVEQSSENKISASLEILEVESVDEGSYVCQAENAAGSARGNLTLRVLRRERSTVEPPAESPGAGYAAAIAAGALLGTLLALGCLFLGIFLYARRLRSHSKSNLKQPSTAGSSVVPPSILKKPSGDKPSKPACEPEGATSAYAPASAAAVLMPTASGRLEQPGYGPAAAELNEFGELSEVLYLQQRRFIEPDLINEVPQVESGLPGGYLEPSYRRACLDSAYSNCLDRDGYPLNFGLPKLGPVTPQQRGSATCSETLPRIRQRQQLMLSGSAAVPTIRLSREAEFLARAAGYPCPGNQPVLEIGYAALVQPTPFIPSPPAAYRSEPAALSPRSLLQAKTQLEGAVGGACPSNAPPALMQLPHPRHPQHQQHQPHQPHQAPLDPSENREGIEHPESPDEGYVGDAMDV
ncbi:leucine-rich repeat-containing protein 24 [Nasonia vitripennis]|uniref:Ig-like domain-containing protein n=1 Tax=Nasonia vitripennis TaxID=7425 RepID=A0A7M7Q024_NASVI|nr:leucine-rich repeat-containing protein 24 [Nasonia vitripennis]